MLAFWRRDEYRGDLRPCDHLVIVRRIEVGARKVGECLRLPHLFVGDGKEADGGMLRRQPRAQGAYAARTDEAIPSSFAFMRCSASKNHRILLLELTGQS